MFSVLAQNRRLFYDTTSETPETFLCLVNSVELPDSDDRTSLSKRNRFLLVFIWLRTYPLYCTLVSQFGVSISTVKREVRRLTSVLEAKLRHYLQWPSDQDWRSLRGNWRRVPCAVGSIDGTSHEIYRPVHNQERYYSGHRNYHCLHTQVVIDNLGIIRFVETGFYGRLNDAQQFTLMTRIGDQLPFPEDCFLLGDKIYSNRHPIMTPYTQVQIRQRHGHERHRAIRVNRNIYRYRTSVERAIRELKIYSSISSIWRQRRHFLAPIVKLCAMLVCRRKELELTF